MQGRLRYSRTSSVSAEHPRCLANPIPVNALFVGRNQVRKWRGTEREAFFSWQRLYTSVAGKVRAKAIDNAGAENYTRRRTPKRSSDEFGK